MRINATCRRERIASALGALVALVTVATAAQSPEHLDDLLARVGERIEQYFARAQSVVFVEKTTIQHIASNLTPQEFARVLESEVRLEPSPPDGDGDGSSETKVVRELRKINGHTPRPSDARNSCLDPNPVSPEPLAFLLPAQRGGYLFKWIGYGKGKDLNTVIIDFRELGRGPIEVKERTRAKNADCDGYEIDFPGRVTGRLWVDAATYEVVRMDQRLSTRVDFRLPESKHRRALLDDFVTLERYDVSIRYRRVPFRDPEELVVLPESIDILTVARGGLQSYRMKQVFSDYRRFVTDAKLVK